ncbi:C40 family peptidase, partial [Bacillus cereus]
THAENNLEYVNKSFYSYAEPSFNSAKQNSGVQYGPQDVRIIEKRDNGWWKIGTWEGDSWINVNGESRILADLYAYEEPSFSSQKANSGQKYGRQTFIIIDGTTDGWLKIQTWEGDKWINPKTQQETEYVGKDVFSYDEPSFNSQKANSGHPYGPQNWNVIEKRSNGWWKVATYEGEKWLAPNGELRLIEKPSFVYNEPSFNALKGNGGYKYDAQNFNIIDGTKNGWLKVQTWEGDKWMIPNGELRFVNKSLYVYNEPSFSAVKGNGGYKYNPQNFNIIDGTTDGWLKVQTWEGDKWLNMNETDSSSSSSGVVDLATKLLGKPYVFGADGPNAFDCSGFISYVFKNNGYKIGRNSVAGYWGMVTKISDPQPGDLVFLQNTYKPGPSHLGIYVGNGEYIHAADETTGVIKSKINSSYTQKHFLGYARFSK